MDVLDFYGSNIFKGFLELIETNKDKNDAQDTVDDGLQDEIDALEARITALEEA